MMERSKVLIMAATIVILTATILSLFIGFNGGNKEDVDLRLVIDHDGGADDAMAITMAVLYEKYFDGPKLIALTTVFGNVDEDQAFINSQRILNVAGRKDVAIYRGCSSSFIRSIQSDYYFGKDGLGDNALEDYTAIEAKNESAALAMIKLSKTYEGRLIVVAIGSLTNIALAVKLDPNFISRLRRIYVAAGNIEAVLGKIDMEFNAAMDAEAYQIVARAGQPDKLTFIPFSRILIHQNITNDWRINVLGSIPTYIMRMQNSFERTNLNLTNYWCLLDPSAMAIALNETAVVEARNADCSIELCGSDRGLTLYNFTSMEPTARVIYKVNKEPYKDFLHKLFSAETQKGQN